jgi:hypothetical protein
MKQTAENTKRVKKKRTIDFGGSGITKEACVVMPFTLIGKEKSDETKTCTNCFVACSLAKHLLTIIEVDGV